MRSQKLILTALMLTGGSLALGASGWSETSSQTVLDRSSQMHEYVQRSIEVNRAARDQQEWDASGFTPADIFQNARDFLSSQTWNALCAALERLSPEDLALFATEIDQADSAELSCRSELQSRLQKYWTDKKVSLAMSGHARMAKLRKFGLLTKANLPLPSTEVHIDTLKMPILERGDLKPGQVAFTFDDGPHPRSLKVMEILKRYGVRGVFFEVGKKVRANPEISRELVNAGHIVASHSWSHPQLTKLPLRSAEQEILAGKEAVMQATGLDIPFFRFPYGAYNRPLRDFMKGQGMSSFFWNMDSLDWKIRDPEVLLKNVMAEVKREKGGILLFHDIHEQTVIVLPHVLDELRARNFETVLFVPH